MAIEKQEYSHIGLTKKRSSRTDDDELRFLVPPSFNSLGSTSFTPEVIIIDDDDDENETLEPKKKKPRLGSWWADDDAINELSYVVKRLPKSKDAAAASVADSWFSSINLPETKTKNKEEGKRSLSSRNHDNFLDLWSDDDDDENETLEPKKKKPRLGSWWDDDDAFNELSCVVKGLPKSKDAAAASVADSWFSSTNLPETKNKEEGERSLSSRTHDNFLDLCSDEEGYSDSIITSNKKENQDRVGYGHVSVEDSTISVEEPCLGGSIKDKVSPVDSCFSSSVLLEKETDTNTDHERSLPSSHHADNSIDLTEDDENVCESINSSNRSYRHVTLDELGVTVEDLKNMPWEAFDPTWEIRSETMDPWLGGYVNDMLFAHSQ